MYKTLKGCEYFLKALIIEEEMPHELSSTVPIRTQNISLFYKHCIASKHGSNYNLENITDGQSLHP